MRVRRKLLAAIAAIGVVAAGAVGVWTAVTPAEAGVGPNLLPVTVTNNTGRGEPVYFYVLGVNLSTGRLGYVNASGAFTPWPAGGNPPTPAPDVSIAGLGNGGRTTIQVPRGVSGRVYFSLGRKLNLFLTPDGLVQPAPWAAGDSNRDILFDWSEFTYNDSGLWLNSSQVDMFAVPHTVSVTNSSGATKSTGTLVANGRDNVINSIKAQPGWAGSVYTRSDGTVLRVLAPGKAADAGQLSATYLDSYITSAWNAYTGKTLTVVPFGDQPNIKYFGRTSGTVMNFTNAAGQRVASFNKPTSANVWGCDGNLGAPNDQVIGPIARTLCAALNRGTLGTIDTQPSTNAADFYNNNPTNQYAKIIHQNMADGKAYAFAFDDVGNHESLVHDGEPRSAGITLNPFTGGGGGGPTPTPPTSPGGPPVTPGGDLGPNVIVFDPSQGSAAINSRLQQIFSQQESNQFGTQRYQILFRPGTYNGITANVGFYTSINGLGRNPDDVNLNSSNVTVDAQWFKGNATQNFWRSAENFSVSPPAGQAYERWAVAQAAPMRRVHVKTHLSLTPDGFGWASGGYLADSQVDGQLQPFSQQQWFTRNSGIAENLNAVWNNVFVGVNGAPASSFPNPPYTTISSAPTIREKPYLYLNGSDYAVWVPSLRTNAVGKSWPNTPGTSVPLSKFYVAHPGDSAATINRALAQGLNLLFTPGIYHVNQTINVTRADTTVLGLGYATIIPDGGVTPMQVADVDGVKIAGLLFDAGTTNSPNLLVVGPNGSSASHAANPTTIQDVFFRIGGAGPGSATNSLLVNSPNTIIDHIWAWRADHGAGVGWTFNPADSGLIVNGANVTAYALFVEHYQKYEVQWNANGGRTYFLQNEQPYDPPNNATWRQGANGYAAYKVADNVTSHEAWGMGSYCYFNVNPAVHSNNGFEAPVNGGVKLHNIFTVSLGGVGVIEHVVNNTGGPAQGKETVPVNITNFP